MLTDHRLTIWGTNKHANTPTKINMKTEPGCLREWSTNIQHVAFSATPAFCDTSRLVLSITLDQPVVAIISQEISGDRCNFNKTSSKTIHNTPAHNKRSIKTKQHHNQGNPHDNNTNRKAGHISTTTTVQRKDTGRSSFQRRFCAPHSYLARFLPEGFDDIHNPNKAVPLHNPRSTEDKQASEAEHLRSDMRPWLVDSDPVGPIIPTEKGCSPPNSRRDNHPTHVHS